MFINDPWPVALSILAWNSLLFLLIGRWSVIRGSSYQMGQKILGEIDAILHRRKLVGEGGMSVVSVCRWLAFNHVWEIRVVQETSSVGDRTRSGTEGSASPQR